MSSFFSFFAFNTIIFTTFSVHGICCVYSIDATCFLSMQSLCIIWWEFVLPIFMENLSAFWFKEINRENEKKKRMAIAMYINIITANIFWIDCYGRAIWIGKHFQTFFFGKRRRSERNKNWKKKNKIRFSHNIYGV